MSTTNDFAGRFSRCTLSPELAAWMATGEIRSSAMPDRENRIAEVHMAFPRPLPKKILYEVEAALAQAYTLNRAYLLPHYPPESFGEAYLPELITETERTGIVARGFFDGCDFTLDMPGRKLNVGIAFRDGGLALMNLAGTADMIARILRAEFSLDYTVTLSSNGNADERAAEAERFRAAELERLLREAAEYTPPAPTAEPAQSAKPTRAAPTEEAEPPKKRVTSIVGQPEDAIPLGEGKWQIGKAVFDLTAPILLYDENEENTGENLPYDKPIADPTPLSRLDHPVRGVTVVGQVDAVECKDSFDGSTTVITVGITDYQSSIQLSMRLPKEQAAPLCGQLLSAGRTIRRGVQEVVTVYNLALCATGYVRREKPRRLRPGESPIPDEERDFIFIPSRILKVKRVLRQDDAPVKRVELHLHTNLSTMDALIFPEFIVETAERWGWDCFGVTDHGSVQAYPLLKDNLSKRPDMKILYGMEAYYVDDTARALYGSKDGDFRTDEFIVFDTETTGLSTLTCDLTEIGAVKVRGGKVLERWGSFVNPGYPIPPEITSLTGITDEMVKDAPSQEEAVRAFLRFAGDRILIAHNAPFDIGFLRKVCEANHIPFSPTYLDTVALSRDLNPGLRKHKLDILAEHYGLGDFNHHRAYDDAEMLSLIFFKMCEQMQKSGIYNFSGMNDAMAEKADPKKLRPYHMVIYAKNKVGLKNLYRLISQSYLEYFHGRPRIPKSALTAHREGLLLGSACEAGELYQALLQGKNMGELKKIAAAYDYLEIQPLSNNRFLIENGTVPDEEALRNLNRRIVRLGEEMHKPVCATCDAHFLNPEDEIYRKILLKGQKFADGDRTTELYLRTTDEMLAEFAYLGEEKAYEVVVTNTRRIADQIEKILPIPDGAYTPKMEGAEEDLQRLCWERASDWYGYEGKIPEIVSARLEKELGSIISNGFAVLYMIAQKLVWFSESQGYLVGSRGSVGSSFVASMAGISEVNPLPPHYRCPKCKWSEFNHPEVGSGFDLPEKNCPHCGTRLIPDGHDIPFETFLGFHGDKSPDIDLNFSGEVQGRVHKYTEELFGEGHVFKAGTLGTLASKTAYGYVMKYLEEKGWSVNKAEANRLVNGCVGVKRTTGQHPGGIVVIPKEYDVEDFTPVQHPADDPNSDIVTTHFPFAYLHDTILKLDELGHDVPTKYKWLEKYTGKSVMDVPMNDPAVYRLYNSLEPLGLREGDIDCKMGTYALPEAGTRFVQNMLEKASPRSFADLIQIAGLSHGTDVWAGNAEELIEKGVCGISEVIGTRDDIMLGLIRYGVESSLSFKIMESVRKGKGLKPEWEEAMRAAKVPEWYIDSCKKIKYMFPKAHAAAYQMSAVRLAWFKINYPMEFYAAFFSVAPGGFDASIVMGGRGKVRQVMAEIDEKIKNKQSTAKDEDLLTTLQLVDESMARGVVYLPIDLYRSDAGCFLPEDGKIRMPFSTLPGLGEAAAEKIVQARKAAPFTSKQDLSDRAKVPKSVMELLEQSGVLRGMSETDQVSMLTLLGDDGSTAPVKKEKPSAKKKEAAPAGDDGQISLF